MPPHHLHPLLILMTILIACSPPPTNPTPTTPTLNIGLVTDPATFDPHLTTSGEVGIVLRQVYDTLIYRDPNTLNFVPGLAANWTISPEGLEYTFQLQQGVTFHDNTPFNAQAVAANLDRILEFGSDGQARALLAAYESYTIVDNYTITLRLTQPDAAFLDALSQVYLSIASPQALQTYSTLRYQFHQVGTGPFRFEEFIPGNYVVLTRNPSYNWPPTFYQPDIPNPVQRARFTFHTQPAQRTQALLNGQVDMISRLLPTDARALAVNPQFQIYPLTLPGQPYQLLMNTTQYPTDNPTIRQALIIGTNRPDIVNAILQGFSAPAWSPLTATTLFHSRAFANTYAYDLIQARDLLATAGFEDTNNDGILEIDRVPLEVRIIILRDDLSPLLIQRLRTQWADLGVSVQVTIAPTRTTLLQIIETGDYNLLAIRSERLEPTFLTNSFTSNSPTNWTNYATDTLDNTLNTATRTPDIQARAEAYIAAQNEIMQEALILPLADAVNLIGTTTALSNVQFHANRRYPILPNLSFSPTTPTPP